MSLEGFLGTIVPFLCLYLKVTLHKVRQGLIMSFLAWCYSILYLLTFYTTSMLLCKGIEIRRGTTLLLKTCIRHWDLGCIHSL